MTFLDEETRIADKKCFLELPYLNDYYQNAMLFFTKMKDYFQ